MHRLAFILILLIPFSGVFSQSFEQFWLSDHRDNISLAERLPSGEIAFLLNSQSPNLPNSYTLADTYNHLADTDYILSHLCIYDIENKTRKIKAVGYKNDTLTGYGYMLVDDELSLIHAFGLEATDSISWTSVMVTYDFDLNVIEKKYFHLNGFFLGAIGRFFDNGNFIGLVNNGNGENKAALFDPELNIIKVDSTNLYNAFYSFRGFHKAENDLVKATFTYEKDVVTYDSNLEIVSQSITEINELGYNNTLDFNLKQAYWNGEHYLGGIISRFDYVNNKSFDEEVIYRMSATDSLTKVFSYVRPDSLVLLSSNPRTYDFINVDYQFLATNKRACTGSYWSPGCYSEVNLKCISDSGNLRWSLYFGNDANYRPYELIATADSGAVLIAWRYDSAVNLPSEHDLYYLKFDKHGNQELDFFSPFLNTSAPEIEIMSALVYPNPTSDYLYIQSGRPSQNAQLKIFDMSGRTVLCEEIDMTAKIDLRELVSGAYTFILEDDLGELSNGKFVKE